MPYHVGAKGSNGCSGYPVVADNGHVMGCHPTEANAQEQVAALYAAGAAEKINSEMGDSTMNEDIVTNGCTENSDHCGSLTCADCAHKTIGGQCTPGSPNCGDAACKMCQTKKMQDEDITDTKKADLPATCNCPDCQDNCDCGDCVQCATDSMGKREFSTHQRERMAQAGTAMPDGSYPIANRTDLMNAIRSWGRGGADPKVKEHIKRRARALGAEDMIPENWKSTSSKSLWGGNFNPKGF